MFNNIELTIDEIENAYKNMTTEERAVIDKLASDLIIAVKEKGRQRSIKLFGVYKKSQFGPKQALEVLAKVGVWLIYHQPIGSPTPDLEEIASSQRTLLPQEQGDDVAMTHKKT